MNNKGTSIYQKLIDEAYDFWSSKKCNYEEFVNSLSPLHAEAVILGNLNYQVENGGFIQWYENDYYIFIEKIIDTFKKIQNIFKDEKCLEKIIDILYEISEDIDWTEKGISEAKNNMSSEYLQFIRDCFDDHIYEFLSGYDDVYYGINNKLQKVIEKYFEQEIKKQENV